MTPTPKNERARQVLEARRLRIRRIRRRIAATGVATFALVFGVIAGQGSVGSSSTTASAKQAGQVTNSNTGTSASASTSSSNTATSAGSTAVTTQQS
jgi:hypothetical protein